MKDYDPKKYGAQIDAPDKPIIRAMFTDEERLALISKHIKQIMFLVGLDAESKEMLSIPSQIAAIYMEEIYFNRDNRKSDKELSIIATAVSLYMFTKYHYNPSKPGILE